MAALSSKGNGPFVWCVLLPFALCGEVLYPIGLGNIQIIIQSQSNTFHHMLANKLKTNLEEQALSLFGESVYGEFAQLCQQQARHLKDDVPVVLLHETYNDVPGAWAVLPLLSRLSEDFKDKKWIFFCEDRTDIDLKALLEVLSEYDYNKPMFLGKSLRDQEMTIIHHFAEPELFTYPHFSAGFALSIPAINICRTAYESERKTDFTIDAKYELAKVLFNVEPKILLTHVDRFCVASQSPNCVTNYPARLFDCGAPLAEDELYIAVKTCKKFHEERVPVLKKTWVPTAKHIELFSDVADPSIPTIDLGVPNTESGHCGKMEAILRRMHTDESMKNFKWFVIADDDTLLRVDRLRKLLSCYNAEEEVAIGEKYGYDVRRGGYAYMTGGSGMILSRAALDTIMNDPMSRCPGNEAPDDMMLGIWLNRADIDITHCPLLHQARPDDYAIDYVKNQVPISFHKFWNNDPYEVYTKWLEGHLVSDNSEGVTERSRQEL